MTPTGMHGSRRQHACCERRMVEASHTIVEDSMFSNRLRMRVPALMSALALCAFSAAAGSQGLSPGATPGGSVTTGTARSGPALAPSAATTPQGTTPAPATPSATTPLPGQSTLPSQLPPLNANGLGQPATTAIAPGSVPTRSSTPSEAFTMLDRGQVGYVTRADTDRIPGFVGFDNADTNRDGQLTKEEFANAWRYYTGQ
jgi:hypothetical protein